MPPRPIPVARGADGIKPRRGNRCARIVFRGGTLYYGDVAAPIAIEDRALAHVKVVIATKLRRGESFTLSWTHSEGEEPGRSTVWLHPSIPLRFVFEEPEPALLSRAWIEELAASANSSGGLMIIPEPDPEGHADSR